MRSMTAFARVEQVTPWGEFVWEIRSVNSRYLEPGFRLPESLRYLETKLRDLLKKQLSRGKVDCSLQLGLRTRSTDSLSVNTELATRYIQAAEAISTQIKSPAPLSALDVLLLPNVIAEASPDREEMEKVILEQYSLCIRELVESRSREGLALKGFLQQRLSAMSEHVQTVRTVMPDILSGQRERLATRLKDLVSELDQNRLEQEMVLQAQKMDVDEELDRLEAHIDEVSRVLNQKGVMGRRLDFLMQELNREVNTLSSKSIHTDTTVVAVEMKVLIEQMREQVQNIE